MQIFEIQEPESNATSKKQIAIGIDFGTTNSLVAYSIDHIPYIIDDELVPSLISDDLEVGTGHLRSIKRLIGKSFDEITGPIKKFAVEENGQLKITIGGKYFTIPDSIALILKFLKNKAEAHLKEDVCKAVITVPAHFDDVMRSTVKQAASIAGLEVLRLISEPTAAAYAYGLENSSEGVYAVYDLGGGTFDISLLRMQMGVFQVLATGGDIELGGDDIDDLILEHLMYQSPLCSIAIAREAKEYLSGHNNWHLPELNLTLNRQDLDAIISPILDRSIKITRSVIEPSLTELRGIILVGGATRIPLVNKLLLEFNVPIYDNVDPDKAVALGAALQAENLTHGSRDLIIDVVPLSLGMELMGGIVEKIILRNTPIPISVTKEFTTYADNQTEVQINIVQGEREMVADCRPLAKFALQNIPPMKAGFPRIEVTFTIDADGLVSIFALEKVTNTRQAIDLRPTYGIDEKDVIQMLEDSYIHAEKDHISRLLTETIIDATQEINNMKAALIETPGLISVDETHKIEEAIMRLEKAVDSKNRGEILESVEQMKSTAERFVEERMNFIIGKSLEGRDVGSMK